MATNIAVAGATLQCSQASVPGTSTLIVTSQLKAKASAKLIGTINDNTIANITGGTFGTCALLGPGPCVPVLAVPWSPGSIKCKCGGQPALLDSDTLICSVGGIITINNAGQTKAKGV